jgi:hypothetical protein
MASVSFVFKDGQIIAEAGGVRGPVCKQLVDDVMRRVAADAKQIEETETPEFLLREAEGEKSL